ncbi:MAG: thioredoxin fold domain-containing protein [candidate division Zixibacteria bacterium]|nr:thioredoxin fold domain-containing protein [candidate division Zixibacteria bacterium]
MNKTIVGIVALFFVSWLVIYGFKGQFGSDSGGAWQEDITWSETDITKEQLASVGKPVYIFFSTEWCTYCRKMKTETFTDPDIQNNLSNKFVSLYINPETSGTVRFSGEEMSYKDLTKKLGVTGYPTSAFYSDAGELIGVQPGYLDTENLKQLTDYIGDGYYKDKTFQEFLSASNGGTLP